MLKGRPADPPPAGLPGTTAPDPVAQGRVAAGRTPAITGARDPVIDHVDGELQLPGVSELAPGVGTRADHAPPPDANGGQSAASIG